MRCSNVEFLESVESVDFLDFLEFLEFLDDDYLPRRRHGDIDTDTHTAITAWLLFKEWTKWPYFNTSHV